MNFTILIFVFSLIICLISSQFCNPSQCSSGCCKDHYTCQVLTSSDRSALKNCYSGDCNFMKCGTMCCSSGRCYDSSSSACSSSSSSTSAGIIVAIIVPIAFCFIVVIIICIRRQRYNRRRYIERQIPAQTHVIIAQPEIVQAQAYYQMYPQAQQQQPQANYNYQQNVPINNVVLPQGQEYFPNDAYNQENYAVHQSNMGGNQDNVKIVGQPPQYGQPGQYNMGQPAQYNMGQPGQYNMGQLAQYNNGQPGQYNNGQPGQYNNNNIAGYQYPIKNNNNL